MLLRITLLCDWNIPWNVEKMFTTKHSQPVWHCMYSTSHFNHRLALLLVLSHVTFVSCGKEFAVFLKRRQFIGQKKGLFFKCTDILLQNRACYFLHCSSIVVLYILLKQTNLSCNITGMLLTFMLFSMTVLFNLMVKTVNQLTLWPKLLSPHYCCIW